MEALCEKVAGLRGIWWTDITEGGSHIRARACVCVCVRGVGREGNNIGLPSQVTVEKT